MKVGVVETNGHQNYRRWAELQSFHPCCGSPWMAVENGCFPLNDDFYARSGGILQDSEHYLGLVLR